MNKIQLCEECGSMVFYGKTMTCSNGHDIDISKLTRDDVVPFYTMLIENSTGFGSDTVKAFNKKIIDKWSNSALTYIKDKAWKQVVSTETPKNFVFGL